MPLDEYVNEPFVESLGICTVKLYKMHLVYIFFVKVLNWPILWADTSEHILVHVRADATEGVQSSKGIDREVVQARGIRCSVISILLRVDQKCEFFLFLFFFATAMLHIGRLWPWSPTVLLRTHLYQ